MDQSDDPRELERKIEQATRIASRVADQTTVERLRAWIEDLKQGLRLRREARRIKQESPYVRGKFGNRTDVPQAATWISGFKPSPRSASAIGSNQLFRYLPLGCVP